MGAAMRSRFTLASLAHSPPPLFARYDVEFLDHAEAWHYIPLARPLRGMPIRLRPRHLTGKAPSA